MRLLLQNRVLVLALRRKTTRMPSSPAIKIRAGALDHERASSTQRRRRWSSELGSLVRDRPRCSVLVQLDVAYQAEC